MWYTTMSCINPAMFCPNLAKPTIVCTDLTAWLGQQDVTIECEIDAEPDPSVVVIWHQSSDNTMEITPDSGGQEFTVTLHETVNYDIIQLKCVNVFV